MTFICYIRVDFTYEHPDHVGYNEDFVLSMFVVLRFCFIHFTVTLAGLKNIVRYTARGGSLNRGTTVSFLDLEVVLDRLGDSCTISSMHSCR